MFKRKSILPSNHNHPRRGDLPVFLIILIGIFVIWLLSGYIEDDCTDCYAYGDCFYYSGGLCYGTIGCIDGGAEYSAPPVCNFRVQQAIRGVFGQFNSPAPDSSSTDSKSLTPAPDEELNPGK